MPRNVFRHGLASVLVMGAVLVAPDVADAAAGSRICRQIEAQLSGGGGSSQSRKFSAAAQRQRGEIAKVRRQLRAAGCGFFSSGGSCRSLSAAAARMERNLSALQRGQGRQSSSSSGRSRGQLLAALAANDCRTVRRVATASRQPGLFERFFVSPRGEAGGSQYQTSYYSEREVANVVGGDRSNVRRRKSDQDGYSPINPGYDSSSYRTFCVRTCDGYYFPMSPSSSRSEFARDGQNCQAACPGAETQVYYHRGGQEDAAEMTSSVSGKPYSDMATAFLYRSDAAPNHAACSCSALKPQGFTVIAGETKPATTEVVDVAISEAAAPMPLPRNRPDPAADPETLLNREGKFGPDAIRRLLSSDEQPAAGSERKVRVVGPVFLPDQAKAAALPAQDRTEVR